VKGVRQKPLPACYCTLIIAAPRTGNLSAAQGACAGRFAIGLKVRFTTPQQRRCWYSNQTTQDAYCIAGGDEQRVS
jgi:hypothetical protein